MPSHSVQPGDTLIRIAFKYGFPRWQTIYEHAENAALRSLRPDPQVLFPGDVVFVPEIRPKTVSVATGKVHSFKQKSVKAILRLVVEDEGGKPCANKPYSLEVGLRSASGKTKGDGLVEIEVDPDPKDGVLTVWPDGKPGRTLRFELKLGGLNPIDTPSGLKGRLLNLGFDPGPIDGPFDDATRDALRNFQIVSGLPVTGEADAATKAALIKAHDKK